MNSFEKLQSAVKEKESMLCVGLDPSLEKLPLHFKKEPASIFDFCKSIIDSTSDYAAAFKLNFAFFEQYGIEGYEILKKLFDYIPKDIFTIADAKRGDIGNTSAAYARSVFDFFGADSVTVNPYMGYDSVRPFLDYKDKITFILSLTSNPGSDDFQHLRAGNIDVFQHVIYKSILWARTRQIGYVVGATHAFELEEIRNILPSNTLLIPGVGAQGGNIHSIVKANQGGPAIINVSRSVIFASEGSDFAEKAAETALYYKNEFNKNQ